MVQPGLRVPLASLLAAVLATACASFDGLAPKAVQADAAALAARQSLAGARLSPAAWPSAAWWQRFGDPQLDALIAEALAGNPGMGSARSRIDRAVALAAGAGAALAPQASASADITRQHFSANGIFPPPLAGAWHTQTQLAASFNYELDL